MTRLPFHFNILTFFAVIAASATAQTDTTFTYQGDLKQNGKSANGAFNLEFSLWNAVSGGAQIGPTNNLLGVEVTDGRFTVELDFGSDAFDNANRWLQIKVNGFTLSPRNPITRAPYSIQTRGIHVDDFYNVGIGTTTPDAEADLHISGDHATLRLDDDDSIQSYGLIEDTNASELKIYKFVGDGQAVLEFNPLPLDSSSSALVRFFRSTNTDGSKHVQFLRGNNSSQASASIGSDGENSFFQAHGGNVGIGTDEPNAKLDVVGDVNISGQVTSGAHAIKPPFAYGVISSGGAIISASSNVVSTTHSQDGYYFIDLADGGVLTTDVMLVTARSEARVATARVSGNRLWVRIRHTSTNFNSNSEFSFVVYRP